MTSKISFFKLLKEDFKRRSWLAALIWLACFTLQPVAVLLNIDRMMNSVKHGYTELSYVIDTYRMYVGAGNDVMCLLVMVVAVVAGVSGYAYLHSRVKLDFYHSLPVSRRKFFFVQYVSGILMFLVPYAVCTLLCLLVGMANGLLTGATVVLAAKMAVYRLLEFLSAYGTAILATVLTGKLLTAILGTVVLALYLPMVLMVLDGMKSTFLATYVRGGWMSRNSPLLSSAFSGLYAESMFAMNNQTGKWIVIGTGVMIFWTVVMTGLSIWLYSVRRTEAAEHSMAFPKTESVIKMCLVIPLSLAIGLSVQDMVYTGNERWFLVGAVCAVIVLCAVIEFIYHLNMREIFRHKLQAALAVVITAAVTLFFRYDITGYDTYLPAKEDVAQMAVYEEGINGSFYYPSSGGGKYSDRYTNYSAEAALNSTLIDKFTPIYELAEKGARGEASGEEDTDGICVEYRLKSGKREIRQYYIRREEIEAAYTKLFEDPQFLEKTYPIFGKITEESINEDMSVNHIAGDEMLDFTREKRREFLEIYKEELKTVRYEDIKNHLVATLSLSTEIMEGTGMYGVSSTSYGESGYPICEKFKKTIDFLKTEAGVDVSRTLTAEEIDRIEVTDYREDSGGIRTTVTDPAQIQEILDYADYTPIYGMTGETEAMDIYVVLRGGYCPSGVVYFKKGNVPDFLEEN